MEGSASSRGVGPRAWLAPVADAVLALAALGAWELRFGSLGPEFDADLAVPGAMVLRPIDLHFVYFWGQSRLGSLIPALGKALRFLLGLPAAQAAQLAVYLCSALALWLMLGLVRGLAGKLVLATFCAFPAFNLAGSLLSGQPLPGMLLFGAGQLRLFLAWQQEPTRGRSLWLGLLSGALAWAGEPGLFLVVGEALAIAVQSPRPKRLRALGRMAGWIAAGAVPFVLLIAVAKRLIPSAGIFHVEHLGVALTSLLHLGDQLSTLWPALGVLTYPLLVGLAMVGAAELVRAHREGTSPTPLAIVALVPLMSAWGVASSRWFVQGDRSPRYLTLSVVLAAWAVALVTDELIERWPSRRRWVGLGVVAALVTGDVVIDSRHNDAGLPGIALWQSMTGWMEGSGCQGAIGGYWLSYQFFTLSDGRLLATPYDGQYVRNRELADEPMRVPVLCALPWWTGPCWPELEQFGVRRRLRDEVEETILGKPQRLCRYDPE